eukprot:1192440-Rhodomonas_salina.1
MSLNSTCRIFVISSRRLQNAGALLCSSSYQRTALLSALGVPLWPYKVSEYRYGRIRYLSTAITVYDISVPLRPYTISHCQYHDGRIRYLSTAMTVYDISVPLWPYTISQYRYGRVRYLSTAMA